MKKHVLLLILIYSTIFATVIKKQILSVHNNKATIKINNINVGISGFVVKHINKNYNYIVKYAVVTAYNKKTHIAVLKLSKYIGLKQPYLPNLNLKVTTADSVYLAFGYNRALLIAPNQQTYIRITKALPSLQWIHPDIFATLLSVNGHPSPLKSDFHQICNTSAIGLLYFYMDKTLFTLDCKSFKILQISPAPLRQTPIQLPFYNRIGKIQSSWFGSGRHRLKSFASYYFKLLIQNNKNNKQLYNLIKIKEKKSI